MVKLIILGAGATRGAFTANPQYLPPLLADLPKAISYDFLPTNTSLDGPKIFRDTFSGLIKATNTENDVELLFTTLQILVESGKLGRNLYEKMGDENRSVKEHHVPSLETIALYLKIANLIPEDEPNSVFLKLNPHEIELIEKAIEYYNNYPSLGSPINLFGNFASLLAEYFNYCLTDYYCKYHAKLFESLTEKDTIVTFNYDLLADKTLYQLQKLTINSFDGLGFGGINIPHLPQQSVGPKYIKLHGSFNWVRSIDGNGNIGKEVYYELLSQNMTLQHGNTPAPVILPTHHKDFLYNSYPIYKSHLAAFTTALKDSDEIWIVGKNFNNSDLGLNERIKEASKDRRKNIFVIDPNHQHQAPFISTLFNGDIQDSWKDLKEFYDVYQP
jgi:hypothetical protein